MTSIIGVFLQSSAKLLESPNCFYLTTSWLGAFPCVCVKNFFRKTSFFEETPKGCWLPDLMIYQIIDSWFNYGAFGVGWTSIIRTSWTFARTWRNNQKCFSQVICHRFRLKLYAPQGFHRHNYSWKFVNIATCQSPLCQGREVVDFSWHTPLWQTSSARQQDVAIVLCCRIWI